MGVRLEEQERLEVLARSLRSRVDLGDLDAMEGGRDTSAVDALNGAIADVEEAFGLEVED